MKKKKEKKKVEMNKSLLKESSSVWQLKVKNKITFNHSTDIDSSEDILLILTCFLFISCFNIRNFTKT